MSPFSLFFFSAFLTVKFSRIIRFLWTVVIIVNPFIVIVTAKVLVVVSASSSVSVSTSLSQLFSLPFIFVLLRRYCNVIVNHRNCFYSIFFLSLFRFIFEQAMSILLFCAYFDVQYCQALYLLNLQFHYPLLNIITFHPAINPIIIYNAILQSLLQWISSPCVLVFMSMCSSITIIAFVIRVSIIIVVSLYCRILAKLF